MKRMATLVEELTAAYEAKELTAYKHRLEMADVLIIDEWGYLPITVTGTRLLFDIIADCYECRSVILTTNMPVAEWNKIFTMSACLWPLSTASCTTDISLDTPETVID